MLEDNRRISNGESAADVVLGREIVLGVSWVWEGVFTTEQLGGKRATCLCYLPVFHYLMADQMVAKSCFVRGAEIANVNNL